MAKKKEQEPQEQTPAALGIEAVPQRTYRYQPQENITAYELALMMPVFVAIGDERVDAALVIEGLPDGARRHWVEWEQE